MKQEQSITEDSAAVGFDTVFTEEIDKVINVRRRKLPKGQRPPIDVSKDEKVQPSVRHDLRGLALSGGGIRSATFNLGLLQALGEHDGLRWCDYLSTVSGGGYIGSCLTSLFSSNGTDAQGFPLPPDEVSKSDVVNHLRQRSSYLAPRHGPFKIASWSLVSHYAVGLLLSIYAVIVPLAVVAIPSIVIIKTWSHPSQKATEEQPSQPASKSETGQILTGTTPSPDPINTGRTPPEESPQSHMLAPEPLFWVGFFALLACISCLIVSWQFSNEKDPWLRKLFDKVQGLAFMIGCLCLFCYSLLYLLSLPAPFASLSSWRPNATEGLTLLFGLGLPLLALAGFRLLGGRTHLAQLVSIFVDVGAWIVALAVCLGLFYLLWVDPGLTYRPLLGALCIAVLLGLCFDLDFFSMLSFYRDRLTEAFVISRKEPEKCILHKLADKAIEIVWRRNDTAPVLFPADSLLLTAAQSPAAPLHLINATVNLPGSRNPELQTRGSDFFLLSPLYSGSHVTGYRKTKEYGAPRLTLAHAMAISGAAVNPQFGRAGKRARTFVRALLNVRLGAWVWNPRFKRPGGSLATLRRKCWPWDIVRELCGRVDETNGLVNLSDGGHIENLGVYELLRRRCRLIVASDAGEDPEMKFEDLETLKDEAQKDEEHGGLGVKITLNLKPLQRNPKTNLSQCHAVSGTIRYPNNGTGEEKGTIIYIKSTLTEDDPLDLRKYKEQDSAFPHDSTMRQFFDKQKFDSYRRLGYCVGKKVLESFPELFSKTGVPSGTT